MELDRQSEPLALISAYMSGIILTVNTTNLDRCILCQQSNKKKLIQPGSSSREVDQTSYRTFARNIPLFAEINGLPILFNPARLNEGVGMESRLKRNKAKYHFSCKLLLNNTKLERAQMRAQHRASESVEDATEDNEDAQYHSRRPRRSQSSQDLCFICDDESITAPLREAMTMEVNTSLNECARNLGDTTLLAKLSASDVVAQEFKYHPACLAGLYNKEEDERGKD